MRCLICNERAEYDGAQNGPLCKGCWLGLKMFGFKPDRVGRARKYLVGELKSQKAIKKHRKMNRAQWAGSPDQKFAEIVREAGPVKIPQSIKIVRKGEIIKEV